MVVTPFMSQLATFSAGVRRPSRSRPLTSAASEASNSGIPGSTARLNLSTREPSWHAPNPNFSIEQVRSFYAAQLPELTNAAITGPETVGDRLRYTFERAIGSKG